MEWAFYGVQGAGGAALAAGSVGATAASGGSLAPVGVAGAAIGTILITDALEGAAIASNKILTGEVTDDKTTLNQLAISACDAVSGSEHCTQIGDGLYDVSIGVIDGSGSVKVASLVKQGTFSHGTKSINFKADDFIKKGFKERLSEKFTLLNNSASVKELESRSKEFAQRILDVPFKTSGGGAGAGSVSKFTAEITGKKIYVGSSKDFGELRQEIYTSLNKTYNKSIPKEAPKIHPVIERQFKKLGICRDTNGKCAEASMMSQVLYDVEKSPKIGPITKVSDAKKYLEGMIMNVREVKKSPAVLKACDSCENVMEYFKILDYNKDHKK